MDKKKIIHLNKEQSDLSPRVDSCKVPSKINDTKPPKKFTASTKNYLIRNTSALVRSQVERDPDIDFKTDILCCKL